MRATEGRMAALSMLRKTRLATLAVMGVLAAVVATIARGMWPWMLDDAYITYSYARGFARFGRLVYGASDAHLATTAPLYAMFLGLGNRLGVDIPSLSKAVSALSVLAASAALYLLLRRHGLPFGALVAAFLMATSPLLWFSFGLETCSYIALVCWAFYLHDSQHYCTTAILLALAVCTRADALLPAAVIACYHLAVGRRKLPHVAACAFVVIVALMAAYLTLSSGSPLPVTLYAKQAQTRLGITGFYVGTSFFAGLGIMLKGWASQSPLFYAWVPLVLTGLVASFGHRWTWGLAAWGALHLLAYAMLNVSPYFWYYAAAVPGAAVLGGLGAQWLAGRRRGKPLTLLACAALPLCVLAAQSISQLYFASALRGTIGKRPEGEAKVLPSQTGSVYRKIGEWINTHTTPGATVAVTEVGIIGFYADRPMVDFLGVLQPEVAAALARGDLLYTLPRYMPDYVVLNQDLSTFGVKYQSDAWFLSNFEPVAQITDSSWSAQPFIILRRTTNLPPMAEHQADAGVLPGLKLETWAVDEAGISPGTGIRVRLDQRRTATIGGPILEQVHVDDPAGGMKAWRDLKLDIDTWPTGEAISSYATLFLDKGLPPGEYKLALRAIRRNTVISEVELGPLVVRDDRVFELPEIDHALNATFGRLACLRGFHLDSSVATSNYPVHLTLYWQALDSSPSATSYSVFTHLIAPDGHLIAQHDGPPANGHWPTTTWASRQVIIDRHELVFKDVGYRGDATLEVGLYDPQTMRRIPTTDNRDALVLSTTVHIEP